MDPKEWSLSYIDYIVFTIMLLLSAVIGLYHGFKKKKTNKVEEYLFAGRNIPALPVIMSNMASNCSSIGLVLFPVETYNFGAQMIFISFGEFLGSLTMYFFFLPVFFQHRYTSIFEYLEKRFNRTARLLGSALYVLTAIFYALIIMYSACLAISKAFPIPFPVMSTAVCSLCIVYTVMGGLRGVVWTDFLQSMFMYTALVIIIVVTAAQAGGLGNVIDIANKGGRLNMFNFDPSPFSRYSTWILTITSTLFSMYINSTNPGIIQRYLSLPNYEKAKTVFIYSCLANASLMILALIMGLTVYAVYHDCDPLLHKDIGLSDELIPYHVMNLSGKLPGLTGLFFAGILSAALSSLSTMMNSLSGIVFDDFIKPLTKTEWNDNQISLWLKGVVLTLGLVVTVSLFGLSPSAGGYQLFRTLTSLTGGLIIFLFCFGLFYRKATVKSALIGGIAGVIVTSWIGIGTQNAVGSGRIKYITKPVSIEGCIGNLTDLANVTLTAGSLDSPTVFADDVPYIFRISFSLIMFVGVSISLIVGLIVSLFTDSKTDVDESLLVPQIRKQRTNPAEQCDYDLCNVTDQKN